jgi:sugar (pentulose or hexulose) kinase
MTGVDACIGTGVRITAPAAGVASAVGTGVRAPLEALTTAGSAGTVVTAIVVEADEPILPLFLVLELRRHRLSTHERGGFP